MPTNNNLEVYTNTKKRSYYFEESYNLSEKILKYSSSNIDKKETNNSSYKKEDTDNTLIEQNEDNHNTVSNFEEDEDGENIVNA